MEFQWDERNLEHAAHHEVDPPLVRDIADGSPRLFENAAEGRSGDYLMIGPDANGRLWTIVMLKLGENWFRPITGWPSTGREIRAYRNEG